MEKQIKAIIHGIVQGVGFRFFVNSLANEYSLKGYVRNLPGGNVEIIAEGDYGLLKEFLNQVKIGPRFSHITNIEISTFEPENKFTNFEIRF